MLARSARSRSLLSPYGLICGGLPQFDARRTFARLVRVAAVALFDDPARVAMRPLDELRGATPCVFPLDRLLRRRVFGFAVGASTLLKSLIVLEAKHR
jgi:hypothetical protein